MSAIPSPAEAIAASLNAAPEGETDINPIAALKASAKESAKPENVERASEAKPEVKKVEAPKSLAESIVSDEVSAEVQKPEVVEEGPREGEKPAQFIKRLKQERADALAQLEQFKSKSS